MKRKKNWEYLGGGCCVDMKGKYVCDETYYNKRTEKYAMFYTTLKAHRKGFPERVRDLFDIKRRQGVKLGMID